MYLYGASGHAKVIIDILNASGITLDGMFDDDISINELMSFPVRHHWDGESPIIVSIGNNMTRKQIVQKLRCKFGTILHPSSIISPKATIGEGSVVMQGAIVQSEAIVGQHCIINTGATIDHECVIDDFVHISPQATLCGNVRIGEGAWIGADAVVIPGVNIGKWAVIGAGSVVVEDIPDNVVAYGNPCRIIRKINKRDETTCANKKKIAIYGAGGLGREVAGGIQRINSLGNGKWELVGFYDDNKTIDSTVSHYGVVRGGMNELNEVQEPMAIAIAVGDTMTRKQILERITNKNIYFPNLIAPSFRILDPLTFSIGQGNIIQDSCSVTCNVTVGDFNVLNGSNVLGHDVTLGNYNVLMPGVRLSGSVETGECNLLGVDSVVLQRIKIGNNVTLGAGSVLMTKPKDGGTYVGVPAKKFNFK